MASASQLGCSKTPLAQPSVPSLDETNTHGHLVLPPEIVYMICAMSLGDYIASLFLRLDVCTREWGNRDAFTTLLHVNSAFRSSTVKLMGFLWPKRLLDAKNGVLLDVVADISDIRLRSQQVRGDPSLYIDSNNPVFEITDSIIPYNLTVVAHVVLWEIAEANRWFFTEPCTDTDHQVGVDFRRCKNLFKDCYIGSFPNGPPRWLLAEVQDYLFDRNRIWSKIKMLYDSVLIFKPVIISFQDLNQDELSPEERDRIVRDQLLPYVYARMRVQNSYRQRTVEACKVYARSPHFIKGHEPSNITPEELKRIDFFQFMHDFSKIYRQNNPSFTSNFPREAGEQEQERQDEVTHANMNESATDKVLGYCLSSVEGALTEEECEVYVKPMLKPGYQWSVLSTAVPAND